MLARKEKRSLVRPSIIASRSFFYYLGSHVAERTRAARHVVLLRSHAELTLDDLGEWRGGTSDKAHKTHRQTDKTVNDT